MGISPKISKKRMRIFFYVDMGNLEIKTVDLAHHRKGVSPASCGISAPSVADVEEERLQKGPLSFYEFMIMYRRLHHITPLG